MPLFQYFGWAGGFLIAALLAANWCCSARSAQRRVLMFRSIRKSTSGSIRIINGLNAWCFDTTRSTLAREGTADPEIDVGRSETPAQAERQLSTRSPRWLFRQALFSTTLLRWPSCGPGR